jgi:hypothetical protein
MPLFKLPLSGDVTQTIAPWSFNPLGGQYGLVNITMGQSSEPKVEGDVLTDVAGYGKQLGRVCDAMRVLIKHLPKDGDYSHAEREAIRAFEEMAAEIDKVKKRHGR